MSRTVQRVHIKSAPDLVVHVGALSALTAIEFSARMRDLEKTQDLVTEQIATFVCNEDGTPRFTDRAQAAEFLQTIRPGQMKKILADAKALNELNDESIEEERKN